MATEQEPLIDDWILVNEDEELIGPSMECILEAENVIDNKGQSNGKADDKDEKTVDAGEAREESPELIKCENSEESPQLMENETRNDTPELLDNEIDSFSVISSLSDNFSYLSWYDNVMEDIIIESGKRCYAHFRNQKLNRSLNFILTVAFTLVAGVAIGNFVGLTKNCEYEKHRLIANCILNSSIGSYDVPDITAASHFTKEKLLEKQSTPRKLIEKSFNSNVPGQFALLALAIEGEFRDHLLIAEDASKDEEKKMTGKNSKITETYFPFIFNKEWSVNSVVDESCNETEQDGRNIHGPVQSEEISNLQLMRPSLDLQNLEPLSVIQYLHNTVDEVMHRAIQLSLSLPTENTRSREDFVNIERTRNVIHKFIGLVKKTLNNLSKSVQSVDFKKKSTNNKYFFKITSSIIKSVDKLMKGVFKEALARREAVEPRLRKIQGLFLKVIEKLQKNLEKDESQGFRQEGKDPKKSDFYQAKYEGPKILRYQKQRSNSFDYSKDHKKRKLYFRNRAD